MSTINFVNLTWEELDKDCYALAEKLKDTKIDLIIAISRGGLVFSRILSDLLTVPISHMTISSYENLTEQKEPRITEVPTADIHNKTILVIDEVSDSGETFKRACKYFDNFHTQKVYTLSPYIKPKTAFLPDFYQRSIDGWIVFPYEIKETVDSFLKTFHTKEHAAEKLLEIGVPEWKVKALIK